jgi:hypothetical protein
VGCDGSANGPFAVRGQAKVRGNRHDIGVITRLDRSRSDSDLRSSLAQLLREPRPETPGSTCDQDGCTLKFHVFSSLRCLGLCLNPSLSNSPSSALAAQAVPSRWLP